MMPAGHNRLVVTTLLGCSLLFAAGCAKKTVQAKVPPPPPPAPAAAPGATLSVYPESIQPGQTAQLTWKTDNANDVEIQAIGAVDPSGTRQVSPDASTTYRLIAKGPGGSTESTARLTVSQPVAVAPPPPQPGIRDLFASNVKDTFFAYDKYQLDSENQQFVSSDAHFLAQHPEVKFTIEGHCDERGSEEYNLALGTSRAEAVKKALVAQGIDAGRISTISYGKEKPFCSDHDEECWHLNRRGHFALPN